MVKYSKQIRGPVANGFCCQSISFGIIRQVVKTTPIFVITQGAVRNREPRPRPFLLPIVSKLYGFVVVFDAKDICLLTKKLKNITIKKQSNF